MLKNLKSYGVSKEFMKIAIDLRKISDKPSGIGYYTLNIVRELTRLKDIELIGFTDILQGDELVELRKNIRILSYGQKVESSFKVFSYFRFIEDKLIDLQPHIFWEPNFLITRNLKKKAPNIRYITTVHDVTPVSHPEFYSVIYRHYFKYFVNRTISWIDGIIYISNTTKQECDLYFPRSLETKSTIIYPVIEETSSDCQIQFEHQEKEESFFLYIGNIEKRKGIIILLNAFNKYRKAGGQNSLIICGNIKDVNINEVLNRFDVNTTSKINYLGYISEDAKFDLIRNCKALIFPSYAEGFGIPPVEALFHNKHIIVSDIPIHKEVLEDNPTYFKLAENDEESSDNLKECMFKHKELFDYNNITNLKEKYNSQTSINKMTEFLKSL